MEEKNKLRFYVYGHYRLDTNNLFYVGIGTKQPNDKGHYRANTHKDRNPIWKSIVRRAGYRIEVLFDSLTKDEAVNTEISLIQKHGRIIFNNGTLSNITDGGEGVWGLKMSDCAKEKMRIAKIGFKHTDEAKEKIRLTSTGRGLPESAKKLIATYQIGNKNGVGKRSQEFKDHLSRIKTGLTHTQETRNKISAVQKGKSRPGKGTIIAYKDGIEINRYERLKFASESLNLQKQLISKVLSGVRNHTGGYTFKRISA